MKRKYSLSDTTAIGIAADLRCFMQKRSFIEPHYRKHCAKENQSLKDLFEIGESEGSKGVICTDVYTLIERIMKCRGLTSCDVKFQQKSIDQGEHQVFRYSRLLF